MKHGDKPKCSWRSAVFSVTLVMFYSVEVLFTLSVFTIIRMETG